MLASLKAKLGPLSSNFLASPDGGAARGLAIQSPDHAQGPRPRGAGVPCATASGAGHGPAAAAAAGTAPKRNAAAAARAAAAMQLDRLNTWRNSLLLRFSSVAQRTTTATSTAAAATGVGAAGLDDPSDGPGLGSDAAGCRSSPAAAAVATGLHGLTPGPQRRDQGAGSESGSRSRGSGGSAACIGVQPRPSELITGTAAAQSSAPLGSGAAPTAATGAPCGGGGAAAGGAVTHLIVMANGLFGSPSNWSVICEQLREHLDMSTVVLHPSKVNRRTDTYDGIDVCGQRLADEIRSVAAAYPSLQRISVIGHSMGGLLLRYAIGVLYNPATGRVAGLRPVHFISLATPHMGCDAEGLAQVPFIGWMSVKPVQKMLQVLSVPTASLMFRRTGRQFFLADGSVTSGGSSSSSSSSSITAGGSSSSPGGPRGLTTSASISPEVAAMAAAGARPAASGASLPLLCRMTLDDPSRGLYFYSALASFASRTAYANTDGDHLVGWANSSLRFMHQLPRLPPEASTARGVVLQDPLRAAFDVRSKPDREPQSALDTADVPIDLPPDPRVGTDPWAQSVSRPGLPATSQAAAPGLAGGGGGSGGRRLSSDGGSDALSPASTAAMAELMLRRLQRLPWRRIDVSFKGAVFGFAHNNIQVTRRWLNFEGVAVAHHLARQVVALEAEWARLEHSREGSEAAATTSAAAAAAPRPPDGQQQAQRQVEPPRLPSSAAEMVVMVTAPPGDGGGFGAAAAAAAARVSDGREQEPLLSEAEAAELIQDLGGEAQNGAAAAEVETAAAAAAAAAAAVGTALQ